MEHVYEEKFYPKKLFVLFFLLLLTTETVAAWHFSRTGLGISDIFLRLGALFLIWLIITVLGAKFAHISIRISRTSLEVGRARLKFVIPRRDIRCCRLDETSFVEYLKLAPRFADQYLPEKKGWRCLFAIWTKPRLVLELKPGREAKPIMRGLLLGRKSSKVPKERFVEVAFPTNHPDEIMKLLSPTRAR
jgi:hypothetical protein